MLVWVVQVNSVFDYNGIWLKETCSMDGISGEFTRSGVDALIHQITGETGDVFIPQFTGADK